MAVTVKEELRPGLLSNQEQILLVLEFNGAKIALNSET
jgi:hypothetical protein